LTALASRKNIPVPSPKLRDVIARQIGTSILKGDFLPGESLPHEIAASEKLSISRTVYRDAMRTLGALGLVDTRKKAGTRVCPRTDWNLLHPTVLHWMIEDQPDTAFLEALFEVRRVIEPAAAAMAAERRGEEHVSRLRSAIAVMRDGDVDSPPYQAADREFHEAILDATGNELLQRLGSIVLASLDYVATYKREQHVPRDPAIEHEALLVAITERDVAAAHDIMERHNRLGREDTLSGLKDGPEWTLARTA
jgi:DNA-binding FadR family transcriptional regulator